MKNILLLFVLLIPVLSFSQTQDKYALIDKQIAKIPDSLCKSTTAIAKYIASNFKTDNEKVRAAFYWTASKISYDIENMFAINFNENSEIKIQKSLETRKGVCINYAEIFNDITNKLGIQSYIIEGYTKQNGFADYVPHAWCGAKIDSKWYVFDPTWGSGYVTNNKFVKKINDFYFKTDPSKIIASHMPFDFLWQFLNYTITNQEFYNGKTQQIKTKPFFDFDVEISKLNTLSELEKLSSSLARIEKNGVKNSLIFDRVAYKKQEIENLKTNDFNAIVTLYNEGVNGLNDFINYRNKQFKPLVSDDEIKAMITTPKAKLLKSQELMAQLGQLNASNLSNVNAIKKGITDSITMIEEQEKFVLSYLSKGKLARKSMFYKATFFGIQMN